MSLASGIHLIALKKPNGERYVIEFELRHSSEVLRQVGRWAANPELSFSWYDAAQVNQEIRKTRLAAEKEAASRAAEEAGEAMVRRFLGRRGGI